jgi:type I restriction enzyme M protein
LTDKIPRIFSGSEVQHGLALFSKKEVDWIESEIIEKDTKFFINCQIKAKLRLAKPEEVVRQLWVRRLLTEYGYPRERIDIERVVYFGQKETGLADIAVLHENLTSVLMIFEVKRPKRTDGRRQLESYCNAEGAPIAVWSNGNEMIRLYREDPNVYIEIPRLPRINETLKDILKERWKIKWLEENDELKKGKTTLKKILLDLEELVLGNAGVDPFEEIFKLIYSKLYDEWMGTNSSQYQLEFFAGDRSSDQIKQAIDTLLEGAKRQWPGVFKRDDLVELRAEHLKICVSFLEKVKLFNSNLQIIDEAFEYLIPQVAKKKEGQFFTPRPVIDMVVKMLNPKFNEIIVDPACGSCGFTLHAIMWVAGGRLSANGLPQDAKDFAQNRAYGLDFADKAVKISKAINLIAGDGKANVYKANSLAPMTWDTLARAGLAGRLRRLDDGEADRKNQEQFLLFDFDILMTNPPFAGTVKEKEILRLYHLAERHGKFVKDIGRHILFIERSLQFIRPGGRMAIILPQGIMNNTNAEIIRRFIMDEARILGVVGLHVNTFKPHTGTKTSVLLLKKHTPEEQHLVQETKAKYQAKWQTFLTSLQETCKNASWEKKIDEKQLSQELLAFIDSYFEFYKNEDEQEADRASPNQDEFTGLVEAIRITREALAEKELALSKDSSGSRDARKDVRSLQIKLRNLEREASQRTLGGRVWLTLNDSSITMSFQEFWVDKKVSVDLDYPIFFDVNRKPVKDNSGEYRYRKNEKGEYETDADGHLIIDHDLDEIGDAFVKFAKKQKLEFWKD